MSIRLPDITDEDYHTLMIALSYIEELSGGQVDTKQLRAYFKSDSKQV